VNNWKNLFRTPDFIKVLLDNILKANEGILRFICPIYKKEDKINKDVNFKNLMVLK